MGFSESLKHLDAELHRAGFATALPAAGDQAMLSEDPPVEQAQRTPGVSFCDDAAFLGVIQDNKQRVERTS